jgi:hypothetical protein
MTEGNVGNLTHDRRLLFISSDIKSSFFFATGIEQGLPPNTVMKLIDIYKDFGIDFVPESKLEVLFERSSNNQKTEEKILYTSLSRCRHMSYHEPHRTSLFLTIFPEEHHHHIPSRI